jgi:hypothetical protein
MLDFAGFFGRSTRRAWITVTHARARLEPAFRAEQRLSPRTPDGYYPGCRVPEALAARLATTHVTRSPKTRHPAEARAHRRDMEDLRADAGRAEPAERAPGDALAHAVTCRAAPCPPGSGG